MPVLCRTQQTNFLHLIPMVMDNLVVIARRVQCSHCHRVVAVVVSQALMAETDRQQLSSGGEGVRAELETLTEAVTKDAAANATAVLASHILRLCSI